MISDACKTPFAPRRGDHRSSAMSPSTTLPPAALRLYKPCHCEGRQARGNLQQRSCFCWAPIHIVHFGYSMLICIYECLTSQQEIPTLAMLARNDRCFRRQSKDNRVIARADRPVAISCTAVYFCIAPIHIVHPGCSMLSGLYECLTPLQEIPTLAMLARNDMVFRRYGDGDAQVNEAEGGSRPSPTRINYIQHFALCTQHFPLSTFNCPLPFPRSEKNLRAPRLGCPQRVKKIGLSES